MAKQPGTSYGAQTVVDTAATAQLERIVKQKPLAARPATIQVESRPGTPTVLVEPGHDFQVLSFRGAEYHLPKSIVSSPLPTLTFRHLEKVTVFALEGKRDKVESSLQRAIASAIDTASLVKIACVAHSEGFHHEATVALVKALKWAKKNQELKGIAQGVALKLGYDLP